VYLLNVTDIAEEDILNTVKYTADVLKASTAANNLLDEIEKTPNIYPLVPDEYLAQKGLRFTMIKNYIMFYTIDEDEKIVTVIRFLYGRRDWKNILKANEISFR